MTFKPKSNDYLSLLKIFDSTNPLTSEIIILILKKNIDKIRFKNKKTKKMYQEIPTQIYDGNNFELILTNSNQYYCSISFSGFGYGGEIGHYEIVEKNYSKVLNTLIKFYSNELEIISDDFSIGI
ncbi:MAG: hypothetical protein LAT82_00275 [Nanoarchaeota archaeon]|nr:hypothetical protein [Nanoarchaeota archaeon]